MTSKFATNLYASKSKNNRYQKVKLIKSVPCMDCKVSYPAECMDFDHVRGEKKFNICSNVHAHGMQAILDEIAKCDIVCSNCHRMRTAARRRSGETDAHNRSVK